MLGGTDLLVRMRDGFLQPKVVVDLKSLPMMRNVSYDPQTGLTIGAAVTMNEVARLPTVQFLYPPLSEAAHSVASYQLRNRATLGGNLCNGSPAADTAPAVLVLRGTVVLRSVARQREVHASEFFLGPGRTAAEKDEVMTAIRFPAPQPTARGRYLKLGRNKAGDLAIAGVAAYGFPDENRRSGFTFRVALASVAPVPLRAVEAEELLASEPLTEDTLHQAAALAMRAARPIDDVRSSAAYRSAMVRNLTLRALRDVLAQMGEED
jgi:carbon-monoxide dehydrogenase medium subunit